MAKRKRLTPADPAHLSQTEGPGSEGLETKAMFTDLPAGKMPAPQRPRAPIADIAADAAATGALNEMAANFTEAKESGRVVIEVPLADIREDYITRDRLALDGDEMAALRDSLRTRGQQTPVEAVRLPGGAGFGLISGWRRCRALRDLHEQTGEDRFARVKLLLRRPEDMSETYLAMVEENEIRANLSYYERAHIVVKAVDLAVFETDKAALNRLFGAATRSRRSKIGSFLPIVRSLDTLLKFPEAISERIGLALSRVLQDEPTAAEQIRVLLSEQVPANANAEQAALKSALQAIAKPSQKQTLTGGLESTIKRKQESILQLTGLRVTRQQDGDLTLSGPRLDEALRSALVEWLRHHIGD